VNDPLLKKVKLKSLEEILARARDIISRHRRRFLQRNLRPCPMNCKQAEMMGRKVIGCSGCGSHDPNQCLKNEKFAPLFDKKQLFKQFADQLRDPGVLLRDYRDVVVFLWILGAFDEELDEELVPLVEKKHGTTPEVGRGDGAVPEEPNYNVANPRRPASANRGVQSGDSGDSEPNYNRAESNSTPATGQPAVDRLQGRARSARQQ
jgi:hypothetical protein